MADLFAAVTDDAVNRAIGFAHARAPYLFNYVSPSVGFTLDPGGQVVGTQDLWLVCSPVPDGPPNVPKYRRMPPFELPGIPIKLPWCIQLVHLKLDFHPTDTVALPAELLPPLPAERFAIEAMLQFGLACLPDRLVEVLRQQNMRAVTHLRPTVLPVQTLDCFVLSVFATGHLEVRSTPAGSTPPVDDIALAVDGIEIVDIAPVGLEHAIECYLVAMLEGYVLPEAVLGLQRLATKTLNLVTPTPLLEPGHPHNPAIEANELRIWLNLQF